MTEHNTSVGIVGKGLKFRLLTAEELKSYIAEISVSIIEIVVMMAGIGCYGGCMSKLKAKYSLIVIIIINITSATV